MMKLKLLLALLLLAFASCSKDSSEKAKPDPEPVDKTAIVNVSAVNYFETVEGVYKYKVTFSGKTYNNKAYKISIDNGADKTTNPTKTYASGTTHTEIISYTSPGDFNLILDLKDLEGNTASDSYEVKVIERPLAITSNISYLETEGSVENNEVKNVYKYKCVFKVETFDDAKYKISLEDGNENTLSPSKEYESGKEYEEIISYDKLETFATKLSATDVNGNKGIFTQEVVVVDRTPSVEFVVEFLSINTVTKIQKYKYSYKVTTHEASNYKVSFDYGGQAPISPEDEFTSGTLYADNVLEYSTLGKYTLQFEITDLDGNKGFFTQELKVEAIPAKVELSSSLNYVEVVGMNPVYHCNITFSAEVFVGSEYTASLKYDDKVLDYGTEKFLNKQNFSRMISFNTHGSHTLTLTVKDEDGIEASKTIELVLEEYISPATNDPFGLFVQPYVHVELGLAKNDFYGSGDVNQSGGIPDAVDASLIRSGTVNKYTDINRDGNTNEDDAQCIDQGMSNNWLKLAHDYWNQSLTVAQRTEFCERSAKLSRDSYLRLKMDGYWLCTTYSDQCIIHLQGLVDPEPYLSYWYDWTIDYGYVWNPMINSNNNAWYNVKTFEVSVTVDNAKREAHSILAFPVGNDLSVPEGWLFMDTATGTIVTPGSHYMLAERKITINQWQNSLTDNYGHKGIMERTPKADGTWSDRKPEVVNGQETGGTVPCFIHPDIKSLQNPNQ